MQLTNPQNHSRELRRVVTPYIGQTVILFVVSLFLIYVAAAKSQWGLLWAAATFWSIYALYVVVFGLKYTVSWSEAGLLMTARGGPSRKVRFEDITSVESEIASPREFLAQARPYRRLVIRGKADTIDSVIDVSLRHFRIEDIRSLLAKIKSHRPDISLPTI
jgi:hypothetical protein